MRLLVGSRGSKLSLMQTEHVLSLLKGIDDSLEFEIVTIRTKGDMDARPLYKIDGKGVFEKEVDQAVLSGNVHFAVHSMKDVPSDLHDDLIIAAVPRRDSPYDMLICKGNGSLMSLPSNSIIGTSSLRRLVQLRRVRGDIVVKPIRGNIDTRLAKMLNGEYDAVVLAEAGLSRLGLLGLEFKVERLSKDIMMPAPGQGALAVVTRRDNTELIRLLKRIEDRGSRAEVDAERMLLRMINAGCRMPLGALARVYPPDLLTLDACILSIDGKNVIRAGASSSMDDAEGLGARVARSLMEQGASSISEEWRSVTVE
ncbi:MAG: hydroxymethylbilane synthase [Candidatus Nitrosocaldus sp.]